MYFLLFFDQFLSPHCMAYVFIAKFTTELRFVHWNSQAKRFQSNGFDCKLFVFPRVKSEVLRNLQLVQKNKTR